MRLLILVLSTVAGSYAVNECCAGDHFVIFARNCSDGSQIDLDCDITFEISNETHDELYVDEQSNLVIYNSEYLPPEKYCRSVSMSETKYLVCFDTFDTFEDTFEDTKRIVISAFELLSVLSFLATILIYVTNAELLDLQGLCTVHSMCGMMTAYIVLVVVNLTTTYIPQVECHLIAYCMYLGFLYSFFWLNVLCFHLWRNAMYPMRAEPGRNVAILYHVYAIGGPLACLVVLVTIHHWNPESLKGIHPGIAETRCWFKTPREAFIYFYTPVTFLLTLNVILFCCTARVLWKQFQSCRQVKVMKYRWRLYVKLFFIMGISWIFEIISVTMESHRYLKYLWLTTDVLNALQGFIIFLILVVFRKRVLRTLANNKMLRKRLPTEWQYLQDSECEEIDDTEPGIPLESESTKI